MEKKRLKPKKTSGLTVHKETLRQLEAPELRGVAGAARIHIPIGFADDTTPIYDSEELP
jgi:hypothetical protein